MNWNKSENNTEFKLNCDIKKLRIKAVDNKQIDFHYNLWKIYKTILNAKYSKSH